MKKFILPAGDVTLLQHSEDLTARAVAATAAIYLRTQSATLLAWLGEAGTRWEAAGARRLK